MDSVYALPGDSFQQIGGECPFGFIPMSSPRPDGDFVADEFGEWVTAPEPVPSSVSRYQGREAMILTRHPKEGFPRWSLFDAFEELLNDPATPAYYRRAWDELQQFERDSAMLNDAADELGLTQVQRDNVFRLAAMLRA